MRVKFPSLFIQLKEEGGKVMDSTMRIKLKPYKGRYCSRKVANRVNDFFMTLPKPDDTALRKEAEEFKNLILARRNNRTKI